MREVPATPKAKSSGVRFRRAAIKVEKITTNMKHKWVTNKDEYGKDVKEPNKPYDFGAQNLGSDFHNGPKCKKCGFEFCKHCEDEAALLKTECGKVEAKTGDDSKLNSYRYLFRG